MSTKPAAIIIGVGEERGIGAALSQRFASEGYYVYVAGRTPEKLDRIVRNIQLSGGHAEAVTVDVTREDQIIALFQHAFSEKDTHKAPELVVFNVGNNRKIDFLKLKAHEIEAFWRSGCMAGFIVGREAVRRMLPLQRGTVVFTGASSSMRGKPGYAHFSAAKSGLRMLSQSMAREFGPAGIHVAHVIIDGGINGEQMRIDAPERMPVTEKNKLLELEPIADAFWFIHNQPPSAWTQEIDLRPSKELF